MKKKAAEFQKMLVRKFGYIDSPQALPTGLAWNVMGVGTFGYSPEIHDAPAMYLFFETGRDAKDSIMSMNPKYLISIVDKVTGIDFKYKERKMKEESDGES